MVGGWGQPGACSWVPSFSLRSPLTELPSVIDVAYWRLGTTLRMSTSTGTLLTPVPSNTHSRHTFAPPRRRSSRPLAAELAGHGSAECLRVDRECRRRCDPELASPAPSPAADCPDRDRRHLHRSTCPTDIRASRSDCMSDTPGASR